MNPGKKSGRFPWDSWELPKKVLEMSASGMTTKEIASELNLEESQVRRLSET